MLFLNMYKIIRLLPAFLLIFTFSISTQAQNEIVTDKSDSDESVRAEALEMFDWKSFNEAQTQAKEDQKKVLIYVNARWCGYCKKMEKEVFSQESVQELTSKYFHPVWIDVDEEDSYLTFQNQKMSHSQFADALQAYSTPTFVFFDENGPPIAAQPGFLPEDIYTQILKYVGSSAYEDQSYEEFSENE
jgi:thioredoxin-related protein